MKTSSGLRSPSFFLALAAIVSSWIGFANPWLHIPVLVLVFPAVAIVLGRTAESNKSAFLRGFFMATAAYGGAIYWIAIPVSVYGGLPWFLAYPCPVLLAMVIALYIGLFSMGVRMSMRHLSPLLAALLAGSMWAVLEHAAGWLGSGFPWLPLAAAFGSWTFSVQSAAFIGGIGLGAFLVFLVTLFVTPSRLLHPYRLVAVLLLAALWYWGGEYMERPVNSIESAKVAIVQGNIDQSIKWDKAMKSKTIKRYMTLTEEARKRFDPELVVWPETAMTFYLQEDTPFSREVRAFAQKERMPIVTGAPAYRLISGDPPFVPYNRAYLITKTGRINQSYDKQHLVPFGEYAPLKEWLPIGQLIPSVGNFEPGLDGGPLKTGNLALGMLICYEIIFPELAQERASQGANLLLTISNDAWFGRSSASLQQIQHAVLRAIEQERAIVRSTNTGISVYVDPRGRIGKQSSMFRATIMGANVALVETKTFFNRHWTAIHRTLFILFAVLFCLGIIRSRSHTLGK